MAKLSTLNITIEIIPCKRIQSFIEWIHTDVILEYHIQNQRIKFEFPSEHIRITTGDFEHLFEGIRKHVKVLPSLPWPKEYKRLKFGFMPLEPSFTITIGSGFYLDKSRQNGSIYFDFAMSLRKLALKGQTSDQIGCGMQLTTQKLLDFVDVLEKEVNSLPSS